MVRMEVSLSISLVFIELASLSLNILTSLYRENIRLALERQCAVMNEMLTGRKTGKRSILKADMGLEPL